MFFLHCTLNIWVSKYHTNPWFNSFDQGFPHQSYSHILCKVLYANSFYSLYCYQHYDHCIANIIILYYMQAWKLYIIKRIYCLFFCLFFCFFVCLFFCLFVCVIAHSEYTDNSKPIFLFLESFFLEKTVFGLCGSRLLLSHSA